MAILGKQIRLFWPCLTKRWVSTGASAFELPLQYVNGKRTTPSNSGGEGLTIEEPATGKTLCVTRSADDHNVDRAVQSAKEAFKTWSQLSGRERGKILHKASTIVRSHMEDLALAETRDTGKPIWEARMDIEGCADSIEYYAGLAAGIAGEHVILPKGSFMYTRKEPLGVCGGIGAWNYPFQMAAWKSAPALVCGNTQVFKPSPMTPLTAVMLAEIYSEAGVPDGVYNVIQGGAKTGELLSSHPDIAKMSFTGSVPSGSQVMQACGKGIKHVTLELGGKSPLIIFEDCDLDNAVKGAMVANFLNQGQVCSNGTRVFVQKSILQPFLDKLVAKVKSLKIGNPLKEDTMVGSMISEAQANRVVEYVKGAVQQGARVLCGGERVVPSADLAGGHYFSPCVLSDVKDHMTVAREEVFGAVASVFEFSTEEEVIRRANDTEFGLAGGVFTRDLKRAHRVIAKMEAGSLYVNNYNVYPCEIPFGGYKKSGIGREGGAMSLNYYTQVKSVYVEMGDVWCPY